MIVVSSDPWRQCGGQQPRAPALLPSQLRACRRRNLRCPFRLLRAAQPAVGRGG